MANLNTLQRIKEKHKNLITINPLLFLHSVRLSINNLLTPPSPISLSSLLPLHPEHILHENTKLSIPFHH